LLICWFVVGGFLAGGALSAIAADKPVLILADVSGSMKDDMAIQDNDRNQEETPKVLVLKELLVRMSREMLPMPCEMGIYRVRYLSGDSRRYEPFLPIAEHEKDAVIQQITDKFFTDYPVFNRRTPLADMLHQLDEQEFETIKGQLTLILISDGRETFYDLDSDETESQNINPNEDVKGPLAEVRRLKEKYGEQITLHTVFLDQTENGKENKGEKLLENMASAGEGKYFPGADLLKDDARMREFCALLCGKAKMPSAEEPQKAEEVVLATPVKEPEKTEGPADADNDGVYDPDDKCPGTPQGARVNPFGCWVLEGVLFAFDKWDIRAQFYPVMDEAVTVLKKNPDLKIVIEGHTDNFGTAAYNEKLSERRANSVRAYFVKKGIEPGRLSTAGYGFTRPVAGNDTPEGRALNRRVELKPIQ
jgi:outer membrane protein OmpA-like peptidoglycan-associated protein